MSEKRRGLGKGIGALIPTAPAGAATATRPRDLFFEQTASSAPEPPAALEEMHEEGEPSDGGSPTTRTGDGKAASGTRRASGTSRRASAPQPPNDEGGAGPRAGERPGGATTAGERTPPEGLVPVPGATFAEIPVEAISPNARQPRQVFDEDELDELAGSIRQVGVLQPVVVRQVSSRPDAYELVMGERRWRAAQLAGLETIPAIIREIGDDNLLRDALLENLHRVQLNALEEAAAYQQLLDDFGCTHEELASRISRSRPQISNTLRLLKLPPLVQRRVAAGVLSAGHARALLGLADSAAMERLAQRIVAEGLSVRATEEIVALGEEPTQPEMRRRPRAGAHSEVLERVASRLTDHFDTRVKVTMGQRKGRIAIEFAGIEDLDRILQALGEQPTSAVQQ